MNDQDNIGKYLRKAIDVGKKVPNAENFVSKLESLLEKGTEDQNFADSLIGLTHDELKDTYSKIYGAENPKKSLMQKIGLKKTEIDMQELTSYVTKQTYLTGVMLEVINYSQTVSDGVPIGAVMFVIQDWPANLEKIKQLKEKGAPFDKNLMIEIDILYNRDTINTLKERYMKPKS